jgi:hypothetical protein
MLTKQEDRYRESAKTSEEKRKEEYQKSQNANYRAFNSALTRLNKMKKETTFEARSNGLNQLISTISGAGSPESKLERLLFSFYKMKEGDSYPYEDIKDAKGDFIRRSPEDIRDGLKSVLFDEEVKSTVIESSFTIEAEIENIADLIKPLYDAFDPAPVINYENIEEFVAISIQTVDEKDTREIKQYMEDIFTVIEYKTESKNIMTTLYEVILELYNDTFGEYPTFYVKQQGPLADYIRNLQASIFRMADMEEGITTIEREKTAPAFSGIESSRDSIRKKLNDMKAKKKEIKEHIKSLGEIDVEERMEEYQETINSEIEEAKLQLADLKEKYDIANSKRKDLEQKRKDLEQKKGTLTAVEWKEAGEKIKQIEEELPEYQRILVVVDKEGVKLRSEMKILQELNLARNRVESELGESFSEQIENLLALEDKITKLTKELELDDETFRRIKSYSRLPAEEEPKRERKPESVTQESRPEQYVGEEYREWITASTKYQQLILAISRKIDVEMKQMRKYIQSNAKMLSQKESLVDYFKELKEAPIGFSEEDEEGLTTFELVVALNKPTLTDEDLSDLQELIIEALKLKRKLQRIRRKEE